MVLIRLDDEVWRLHMKSWALMGVKAHHEVIQILEDMLRADAMDVLDSAEEVLLSGEPEALVARELGLMKQRKKTRKGGEETSKRLYQWRKCIEH